MLWTFQPPNTNDFARLIGDNSLQSTHVGGWHVVRHSTSNVVQLGRKLAVVISHAYRIHWNKIEERWRNSSSRTIQLGIHTRPHADAMMQLTLLPVELHPKACVSFGDS